MYTLCCANRTWSYSCCCSGIRSLHAQPQSEAHEHRRWGSTVPLLALMHARQLLQKIRGTAVRCGTRSRSPASFPKPRHKRIVDLAPTASKSMNTSSRDTLLMFKLISKNSVSWITNAVSWINTWSDPCCDAQRPAFAPTSCSWRRLTQQPSDAPPLRSRGAAARSATAVRVSHEEDTTKQTWAHLRQTPRSPQSTLPCLPQELLYATSPPQSSTTFSSVWRFTQTRLSLS